MASVQNRTGRRTMMFRLVAACGCAVLAACRAAATPYACKLSNVDMNGSADLPRSAGGAFRVRDEAACLTRCQRNSACTAITWFRSAPSHALWNCYLKNPSDASKPLPRGGFDMFFMSSSSAACKSTDESRQTMISDRRCTAKRECKSDELCNRTSGFCEEEIIDLRWAKPVFAPGDQIAVSADGNKLDEDDIGGQPLALALLDASGYKDKLVYFGYSNHVWEQHRGQTEKVFLVGGKMLTQSELMDRTMQESINLYGFNRSMFYDEYSAFRAAKKLGFGNKATDAFVKVVVASSPNKKLWVICAGPVETIYRGLQAASLRRPGCLRNVNIVSHSVANNQHASTSNERTNLDRRYVSTWGDLKKLVKGQGGKIYYGGDVCTANCGAPKELIPVDEAAPVDQNTNLDFEGANPLGLRGNQSTKNWSVWFWMRDSTVPKIKYLWTALRRSTVPDPSDAGMIYWLLTSDDLVTPNKLKAYLKA